MWREAVAWPAALLLILLAQPSEPVFAQNGSVLPTGTGSDVVAARCLTCHQADLITQQRLDEAGWTRELDKMIRWGATVTDTEKPLIVRYLAASEPRVPNPESRAPSPVFARACQTCHLVDIIEQQRLSRAGWARELDKMMRWGAAVSPEEQEPLIDYLVGRFGPRARR